MILNQNEYREELTAQLVEHGDKPLRLWRFIYGKNDNVTPIELKFLDVKFEDDKIVVELGDK